jgi:hypothetical protein
MLDWSSVLNPYIQPRGPSQKQSFRGETTLEKDCLVTEEEDDQGRNTGSEVMRRATLAPSPPFQLTLDP